MVSARSDNETEASRRVKTEFLVQMQGVGNSNESKLLVLGATNLPWGLDSAMRRRFEKRIYIPLPDEVARLHMLKNRMKGEDTTLTDDDYVKIANKCDFFSGSDMSSLIKNACYEPLRRFQNADYFKPARKENGQQGWMPADANEPGAQKMSRDSIRPEDVVKNKIDVVAFNKAVFNTKPTVGAEDLEKYREWTREFGMDG